MQAPEEANLDKDCYPTRTDHQRSVTVNPPPTADLGLYFHVRDSNGIPSRPRGLRNCCVTVRIPGPLKKKLETTVCWGDNRPDFDWHGMETIKWTAQSLKMFQSNSCVCEIWDRHHLGSDELIGTAIIPLSGLYSELEYLLNGVENEESPIDLPQDLLYLDANFPINNPFALASDVIPYSKPSLATHSNYLTAATLRVIVAVGPLPSTAWLLRRGIMQDQPVSDWPSSNLLAQEVSENPLKQDAAINCSLGLLGGSVNAFCNTSAQTFPQEPILVRKSCLIEKTLQPVGHSAKPPLIPPQQTAILSSPLVTPESAIKTESQLEGNTPVQPMQSAPIHPKTPPQSHKSLTILTPETYPPSAQKTLFAPTSPIIESNTGNEVSLIPPSPITVVQNEESFCQDGLEQTIIEVDVEPEPTSRMVDTATNAASLLSNCYLFSVSILSANELEAQPDSEVYVQYQFPRAGGSLAALHSTPPRIIRQASQVSKTYCVDFDWTCLHSISLPPSIQVEDYLTKDGIALEFEIWSHSAGQAATVLGKAVFPSDQLLAIFRGEPQKYWLWIRDDTQEGYPCVGRIKAGFSVRRNPPVSFDHDQLATKYGDMSM